MLREQRRKDHVISDEDAKTILRCARRGVLSVNGDDGYPYAVPLNYLYDESNQKIYFHGSRIGHKADAINKSGKVCFTVIGKETVKTEPWAPFVKSTVVFGHCRIIEERDETLSLVKRLAMKYFPDEALADDEIMRSGAGVSIYEITIEHISGKEVQER